MKKSLVLITIISIITYFSSCKKEEANNGGTATPQETCLLKSSKGITSIPGEPDQYNGFFVYRNSKNIINKINFTDSTGKEDPSSYISLIFSSDKITDIKIFDKGNNYLSFALTYNSANKIAQRSYNSTTDLGLSKTDHQYFYDNQGKISYSIRTTTIDNVPDLGKVISKDSGIYKGYNTFNRPSGIVVYNSITTDLSGTDPYKFSREFAYEYDAKGNLTKTSLKEEDISNPFEVIYTATFNLEKDYGIVAEAVETITKLIVQEGWENPNIGDDDYDKNLIISETITEDGKTTTTNTTYTFNDKGYPLTSTSVTGNTTSTSTLTYDCK